jgi:hypothetical protein
MDRFIPGESYRLKDEGKARLARKLEEMFNAEPMVVNERNRQGVFERRVIKHKFDSYPKLNKQIQEHYDIIYGGSRVEEEAIGEASAQDKMPLPFGYGAFAVHSAGRMGRAHLDLPPLSR